MKKQIIGVILSVLSTASLAFSYPLVVFSSSGAGTRTAYFGEIVRIPVTMQHYNLKGKKTWLALPGAELTPVSGSCPPINFYPTTESYKFNNGVCQLIISIRASYPGQIINGSYAYHVEGDNGYADPHTWNNYFYTPEVWIKFLPHPLSMVNPEKMRAIAGKPFSMNLAKYISYYTENVNAGESPELTLTSNNPRGLIYNPQTLSITGTPDSTGYINFTARAHNKSSTSAPVTIDIEVSANPDSKPRLKSGVKMPAYSPEKSFEFNLMELVDREQMALGDDLSFVMRTRLHDSLLFTIDPQNKRLLKATIPASEMSGVLTTTIAAVSNIGGESLPVTLEIPIAQDPAYKPSVQSLTLTTEAGKDYSRDYANVITDPSNDGSLRLLLDRVEPDAPWLQVSKYNKTTIEGRVPDDVYGRRYTLYLRVSNQVGGTSEPVVSYLNIQKNREFAPRFIQSKPQFLPELIPGQPYDYCFSEHEEIIPSYDRYPYIIRLSEKMRNPEWIRMKDNCLHADEVPDNLYFPPLAYIVVRNESGGDSEVIGFQLPLEGF